MIYRITAGFSTESFISVRRLKLHTDSSIPLLPEQRKRGKCGQNSNRPLKVRIILSAVICSLFVSSSAMPLVMSSSRIKLHSTHTRRPRLAHSSEYKAEYHTEQKIGSFKVFWKESDTAPSIAEAWQDTRQFSQTKDSSHSEIPDFKRRGRTWFSK